MLCRILLIAAIFSLIGSAVEWPPAAAWAAQTSGPRLVGTVEGGPFTGAVFDDGTGVQTFYRLHELLPDGSKIIKVRSDSIAVKRADGVVYELFTTSLGHTSASVPLLSPSSPSAVQPDASATGTAATPRPRGKPGRTRETDD